jgi:hypothetical protein
MIFDVEYFQENHKGHLTSIIIDGNSVVNNCVAIDVDEQSVQFYQCGSDGILSEVIDTIFPRNCSIISDGIYIGGWHE